MGRRPSGLGLSHLRSGPVATNADAGTWAGLLAPIWARSAPGTRSAPRGGVGTHCERARALCLLDLDIHRSGRPVRTAEAAVAFQVGTKPAQRVMKSRLHGADANAEDRRRLLQRQSVEVVEDDHALLLGGQGRDPFTDDLPELAPLGALRRLDLDVHD